MFLVETSLVVVVVVTYILFCLYLRPNLVEFLPMLTLLIFLLKIHYDFQGLGYFSQKLG